ncbi:hypothetical protein EAW55_13880 [Legionella jordanis]|uniref:Uncharacterized protein n=2 Tax=Legionella jordanis TaxID=456 RepID=A0A0W0VG57_9GAMM|nr:hypothetical protein [Legionella jordanis]KTD19112.1 hypothetical protein Ljor_0078 [Legionella jordanis]RMW99291.1 hypothetical protein EAW55_13880 [Legionella jordanis]VEH12921.1 Uncharacterised protein [Legionella jordanis]
MAHEDHLMTKFLKNSKDFVLIKLARGKRYVGKPLEHLNQSAQKGNTCALYALNPLRFRFGQADIEHPRDRFIEKAFSNYCRGFNKIDIGCRQTHAELLEEITESLALSKTQVISSKEVQDYTEILKGHLQSLEQLTQTNELRREIENALALCQEFLNNIDEFGDDFESFLQLKIYLRHIELAKNTITLLQPYTGLSPEQLLERHITCSKKSVINSKSNYAEMLELNRDNPECMLAFWHQTVINLAANSYGLESSPWDPHLDISHLIAIIRENGPQVVYSQPAVALVSEQCHQETNEEFYQIFIDKTKAGNNNDDSHALVIVGAQKTEKDDFVYLWDPNYANEKNSPLPIYKISFQDLKSKLVNIYGVSLLEDAQSIQGPFSYQAPTGMYDKLYAFTMGEIPYSEEDMCNNNLKRKWDG